ncbi:MAG TPA: FAD-binding oxidoreductase [candidate division WOR-3 bacterium]|uniref:FAD-binding oxidoreductase n=1 Tax=candidate division WOR-3 bacterium TaxID=2052148 RepID=A0A7C1BH13_UNCW3|nr:FAD-binding oxidoreductase [candidate division WOR-3 bacterium]
MKKGYEVVIVGGGIIGNAVAYYLAKEGQKDVLVIEKNYISSGSTGRCAGGIRQQWDSEANIRLAMGSVKIFEGLEDELGFPTEFYQGGYLLLAHTPEHMEWFKKRVELQRSLGLDVRLIDPKEAKDIVPYINTEGLLGATFCPTDGHANPFYVTFGYYKKAQELGVHYLIGKEVAGIEVRESRIRAVILSDGSRVEARNLVNAAGGHARDIARMAGIDIPVNPQRHEILVTEPIGHLFDPLIISFKQGIYFRQELNGGVLMGYGDPEEPWSYNVRSTSRFLFNMTKKVTEVMPILDQVRVLRQWAGLYAMTPDAQPIIGGVEEVEGYYQAVGFSGHGFMVGPKTSELLAELILTGKTSLSLEHLSHKRFKEGKGKIEKAVI